MSERTLVMVKPDAVRGGHLGDVVGRFEAAGLTIRALKMIHLDRQEAEEFYRVHRGKPFFSGLTQFMSSGPIVAIVLEAPGAITQVRRLMGATDPAKAAPPNAAAGPTRQAGSLVKPPPASPVVSAATATD